MSDGPFVLGNGPANAMVWALAIVEKTLGRDKSLEVAAGMLLYPPVDNPLEYVFG